MERTWVAPFAVDVGRVLSVHRRGYGDPAFVVDESGSVWRASQTPDGRGTLRVAWHGAGVRAVEGSGPSGSGVSPGDRAPGQQRVPLGQHGVEVRAVAWGPGAGWLLDSLPGLLGAHDNPEDFTPDHPVLRTVASGHRPVRIGRSGLVLEALVPAVLEQKVVGKEATRAWRYLLRRFGEPAPGPAPAGMRVPPGPATWATIPSWDWHLAGVEAVRARTIAAAARVASRLEEITGLPPDEADRRLRSLPGIGPWTSAEVRQRACGDADAVSVGDYHLPAIVGLALAGQVVDDAGMLELLAPYAGHRHRAALMASLSGARKPRRGPRNPVRDYRSF